ncbi:hypothetical protein EMIT0347P_20076 [Pseudomonas sp. IT-347P]
MGRQIGFGSVLEIFPPSPQPSPPGGRGGKGADCRAFQDLSSSREKGADFGAFQDLSSTREKVTDFCAFQDLSSTRYCTSAYLAQTPRSVPSPSGRGLG